MSVQRSTICRFAALVALASVFLLSTGTADASLGEFTFTKKLKEFSSEAIAVDESTGDVYVYTPERTIEKFDAEGNPVNFSSLGTNVITGVSGGGTDEMEMAVDNSSGPASGDIYLAGSFSGVQIFGADGKALGQLSATAGVPWGEVACGVAVDRTGRVYVGVYPSNVNEYVPASNPVTNSNYTTSNTSVEQVCNVAVDPEESLYVDTWTPNRAGRVFKFDSQAGGSKVILLNGTGTLAVANSASAELFVGRGNEIVQYDSQGNLLSTFDSGEEGENEYVGLAINAKNGKLYASHAGSHGKVEIWQGAFIPEVLTGHATGLNPAGSATLNGSVDPEGVAVESCAFQYGTSVSYGSVASCAQTTPLTGASTIPVSVGVSEILPNQSYHYRLVTTDGHGTRYGSDQTFTVLVLPTVEDQAPSASLVTRASAQLAGTIDPEGVDAAYHFEYGETESYGSNTPTGHTGASATDTSVVQRLDELLPDRTYHYRLVAENIAGAKLGEDNTFTTGAATPPTAVTDGSSNVAENAATIAGTVSTNGLPTTYGFEIGTSTDYGPSTGLGTADAGLSDAPVSLPLTGLLPGTTYHYRFTATNIDGTSYGSDQTFTTGVFTNTFAEPPAPLPFVSVPSIKFPSETKPLAKKTGKKKTKKKANKRSKSKAKKKAKNKKKK